jgi:hypothetical protein
MAIRAILRPRRSTPGDPPILNAWGARTACQETARPAEFAGRPFETRRQTMLILVLAVTAVAVAIAVS